MTEKQKKCEHLKFKSDIEVARLEDVQKFNANVRIRCLDCELPFQFLGLLPGLDLNGARVSVDGTEAHLAIVPQGTAATALEIIGLELHRKKQGGLPN